MKKLRVGVIRGGVSSEYDVSLKTGASILRNLSDDKYILQDILLTKGGEWNMGGLPTDLDTISEQVDVVVNALHGEYGEDGKLQRELEAFGIPYTGSGTLASAMGMNKELAKQRFLESGLRSPLSLVFDVDEDDIDEFVQKVFLKISLPLIVKPVTGGSSVGTELIENFGDLKKAIALAGQYSDKVMVEQYIKGREATCCVVESNRPNEFHALHPIEIVTPDTSKIFDYEAKYSGGTKEVSPGDFTIADTDMIRKAAVQAHGALGLRHYSRADFIVSPHGLYILEVNTLPGMTEESLFPKSLETAGVELPDFLDHLVGLAQRRYKRGQ